MKRIVEIAFIAFVLGVVIVLFIPLQSTKPPKSGPSKIDSEKRSNTPTSGGSSTIPSPPPARSAQIVGIQTDLASRAASPNPTSAPGAATNDPPALPPLTVLDKTRVLIHNYHAAFGENPVGTNPEIAAALQGKNPRQINFLADSGLRLNGKGEIIDGYGTPFFFHQISGNEMEIRSAGPDKVMWSADDLVTK
jgi:hypothetical protein